MEFLYGIPVTQASCLGFLESNIRRCTFPQQFYLALAHLEQTLFEIEKNHLVDRWVALNRLSNETLLQRIGTAPLSREFQFLAELTCLLRLLEKEGNSLLAPLQL